MIPLLWRPPRRVESEAGRRAGSEAGRRAGSEAGGDEDYGGAGHGRGVGRAGGAEEQDDAAEVRREGREEAEGPGRAGVVQAQQRRVQRLPSQSESSRVSPIPAQSE